MERKFILLVEDSYNDELLTRRALKKNEISTELIVVRNGEEALDFLFATGVHAGRPEHQLPALVLLDLKLPKVDGLEVIRRLRSAELTKFLPVVVLTSSDEENDVRRAYTMGANSYVRKPTDFTEFVETVRQLSLYWLKINNGLG